MALELPGPGVSLAVPDPIDPVAGRLLVAFAFEAKWPVGRRSW